MIVSGVKRCPRCSNSLAPEFFGKNRSNGDGLADYCKSCVSEYNKRPDVRAKQYARAAKNPEKVKQQWIKSHDNDAHRAQQKLRIKEYMGRQTKELGDLYLKAKIARGSNLAFKDIPQELVELKRVSIQIKRFIKETK